MYSELRIEFYLFSNLIVWSLVINYHFKKYYKIVYFHHSFS